MSSKNANNQGRRTPLSLNSQLKLSQQHQQQTRRSSTSTNELQQSEPRYKQQVLQMPQKQQQQQLQQKREEKKETAAATAVIASVSVSETDPVSAANVTPKQQQKRQEDGTNGYNNGTESNAASNSNTNKAATNNETKIEVETRNKSAAKSVKATAIEQNQNDKNGGDDVVFVGTVSPVNRKPQQQPQQQQKQTQSPSKKNQQQQQKPQVADTKVTGISTKPAEEKVEGQPKLQTPTTAIAATAAAPAPAPSPAPGNTAAPKEKTQQQQVAESVEPIAKKSGTTTPKKEDKPQQQKMPVTKNETEQSSSSSTTNVATKSPTKVDTPPSIKKFAVTTVIDDDEEELSAGQSERKKVVASLFGSATPKATSTPGKLAQAAANVAIPALTCSDSPRTLTISGRRSIRPLNDWTSSDFDNNPEFRGSYRRIKTDLDETNDTNTSLNVTVGSEPGNNTSWFSFRSRKRERTPTDMPIAKEELMSPPKRARLGFFSVVASPFSALRSRFARASITAAPSNDSLHSEEEEEHNVSMDEDVSIAEVDDILPLTESNENSPQKEKANEILNVSKEKPADDIDAGKNKNISDTEEATAELSSLNADNAATARKRCNVM